MPGNGMSGSLRNRLFRASPHSVADRLNSALSDNPLFPEDDLSFQEDVRAGTFTIGGDEFEVSLVDLPCVVESYKTYDDSVLIKAADIGQMILVKDTDEPQPEGVESKDGLTPAMRTLRMKCSSISGERSRIISNTCCQTLDQCITTSALNARWAQTIGFRVSGEHTMALRRSVLKRLRLGLDLGHVSIDGRALGVMPVRRMCSSNSEIQAGNEAQAPAAGDGRPPELIFAGAMFNASANWVLRAVVENFCSILEGKKNINRLSLQYLRRSGQRRALGGGEREYPLVLQKESRIGKRPIEVPKGVTVTINGQYVEVKGPLGTLSRTFPPEVRIKMDQGIITVSRSEDSKRAPKMHGLSRTLVDNMVIGVSQAFEKRLQLIGIGYRAVVENNDLVMSLGFSHPVRMPIPEGIKVKVEENTKLWVSGYDKVLVGNFSAMIRGHRPPEPYNGKGIRYADEVVRKKEVKGGRKK